MKAKLIILLCLCLAGLAGCDEEAQSSSAIQQSVETVDAASLDSKPVSEKPISGPWMQFRVCEIDRDCIVAIGVCGIPAVINKTKITEFKKQIERMSQIVRCGPPPVYDRSELSGSCETGVCVLNGFEG